MTPPAAVVRQASRRAGGVPAGWRLLPCHPWQARHLAGLPEVEAARGRGLLHLLGPLGRSVHPTSSVRTVWDPEWNQFLKLPLDVRVTNFVRVNTPEQVRRSMDASRAVDARRPALGRVLPPGFRILVETAVRAVRYGDGDRLQSSTAVLYREAPPTRGAMVVAGLLEPSPLDGRAPIVRIVGHAAACAGRQADARFVRRWLARYTELSLVPLARLLAAEGLCLEAHPQNSLMAFRAGWPCGFVVRDLEGAAIRRDRALGSGLVPGVLAEHSPVLYDDPEPWRRLAYHVVVNHFGQLVATLAGGATGEPELWAVVRGCLEREATRGPRHADATVVERLLDEGTLPAKANLISRFRGRSEEPLYVDVPNPIAPVGTLA
jgi:siderophore synthetase component